MKRTVFQCITAIICVIALCMSFSSAATKIANAKVEAAKSAQGSSQDDPFGFFEDTGDFGSVPDVGGSEAGATTPADSTVPGSTDAGTSAPVTGDNATGNATGEANTAPKTSAEIVKYYNDAVNKAVTAKAGFNKTRVTTLGKLNGGKLLEIEKVQNKVNSFLAVGTTNSKNTKGQAGEICKASLTASDVTYANCAVNGGVYTISLTLKNGKSYSDGTKITDTSPLARSGLYAGNGENNAYDYKSADNILISVFGTKKATVKAVETTVTAPKIVAKIDSKTGNLISLAANNDWYVNMDTVKYLIISMSADGEVNTKTSFTNFVY